jgi:hypothetical protein
MKTYIKLASWAIIGVCFGTAVGVLARRFGGADPANSVLAGMIVAPLTMMLVLLVTYWSDLVPAAIVGAVAGALVVSVVGFLGGRATGTARQALALARRVVPTGALFGAIAGTWLEAGGLLFKRGSAGIISFFATVMFGACLGGAVWVLGTAVGGPVYRIELAGQLFGWRLGETIAGAPLGLASGLIAMRFFVYRRSPV